MAKISHKIVWVVGSRGEIFTLGPTYQRFSEPTSRAHPERHFLFCTSEQGMAALQSLDSLDLIADEIASITHPADEPAVRLNLMIERVEAFVRRHKGTHQVAYGASPTAAATAIYGHARGCPTLWVPPFDPAGVLPRLRWESGLIRIIKACAPCVEFATSMPLPDSVLINEPTDSICVENEISGLRSHSPIGLIAVLRRDWGYLNDATSQLIRAAMQWADEWPEVDWVIASNLNARIEGPFRSQTNRPSNLIIMPPVPYSLWEGLKLRAAILLTDAHLIAAEGVLERIPTATFADLPIAPQTPSNECLMPLTPGDLLCELWRQFIQQSITNYNIDRCRSKVNWIKAHADYLQPVVRTWIQTH